MGHVVQLYGVLCEAGLSSIISPAMLSVPVCCVCLTPCSVVLTQLGEQCKPHYCHGLELKTVLEMCVCGRGFSLDHFSKSGSTYI